VTDVHPLQLVPVTAPSRPAAVAGAGAADSEAATVPPPAPDGESPRGSASTPLAASAARVETSSPWREWSSFDRTVSFRLPSELVDELEERRWSLRLPTGVTVAAALTQLLDCDDAQLRELVERAENAKPRRRPPGGSSRRSP
jgi:hypothetical protein